MTNIKNSYLLLPVMGLGLTLVGGGVLGGCNEGGGVVTMFLPVRGGGYGNEDGITKFPLNRLTCHRLQILNLPSLSTYCFNARNFLIVRIKFRKIIDLFT